MHEVLVNRLGGLSLPRKSVVRLTDRPDMTFDVYRGRKTTIQPIQQPSYGCCTRVNFVLKKHLLFQMNLSNSGLKNRSIKEYWLIFTVLKFPLGLQFSHNLTKFKIIKYISTIYIMTTTCIYLQQLTQVSDVAHGPLVFYM